MVEFDHEGEFDRIMEEIVPMSIPSHFVKSVVVKMKNGQTIDLTGEELLQPLPMVEAIGWEKLAKRFEAIDDVEVQIDVPAIKKSVITNVKNILKSHFERDNDD